jgi:hypothetical protein
MRRVGAVAGLVVTVLALSQTRTSGSSTATLALIGVSWVAFAAGAWCVLGLPLRTAIWLIILGTIALQVAALPRGPRTSDDFYRYIWDGRVQAAGVDPYRYSPADPALTGLRDAYLWPADGPWCVQPGAHDQSTGTPLAPGCTRINRPAVHTIYPPVAEETFAAVYAVSGGWASEVPIKTAGGVVAVATSALLLVGLRRLGRDPRRAVFWAWCPAVAIESTANGHIDVLAAAITAGGLLVLSCRPASRPINRWQAIIGGSMLGLAVATKITPALVVPAALRRRPTTVITSAISAVGIVYLPHAIAVGRAAIGYLPGYLQEEGYRSGSRFALLTWAIPEPVVTVVAVGLLAAVGAIAARGSRHDEPWQSAALIVGSALILTSPTYTWYAVLLVVLVGLGARWEWLAVPALAYAAQYAGVLGLDVPLTQRLAYGTSLAVVCVGYLVRRRNGTRPGPDEPRLA